MLNASLNKISSFLTVYGCMCMCLCVVVVGFLVLLDFFVFCFVFVVGFFGCCVCCFFGDVCVCVRARVCDLLYEIVYNKVIEITAFRCQTFDSSNTYISNEIGYCLLLTLLHFISEQR